MLKLIFTEFLYRNDEYPIHTRRVWEGGEEEENIA